MPSLEWEEHQIVEVLLTQQLFVFASQEKVKILLRALRKCEFTETVWEKKKWISWCLTFKFHVFAHEI